MKRVVAATVVCSLAVLLLGTGSAQDGPPKITKPVPVVPQKDTKEPQQTDPKLPVVPITEKKVTDTPQVDSDGVLPWSYVKNRIETMPIGTKAYVNVDAIKCDSKRKVFIDPDQLYGIKNEDRVVQISRDATGFHVLLEDVGHQWVCQELPPGQKVLPVKSVTAK